MIILIVIRLIPYIEFGLTGGDNTTAINILAPKIPLGGYSSVDFPWLIHSGVIVTAIALATPRIVSFFEPEPNLNLEFPGEHNYAAVSVARVRLQLIVKTMNKFKKSVLKKRQREAKIKQIREVLLESFKEAFDETISVLVSITAFASMAKLMASFEMTQTIALFFVKGLSGSPALYALFIPVIGMIGSGLTGSTTTSNFLFAKLQVNTALSLKLIEPGHNSVYEITAAQMMGASAGEIISPMNAVVILLMDGVDKKESGFIKDVFLIAIFWLILTMVVSLVFIVPPVFID
jgi:L-lactate permease